MQGLTRVSHVQVLAMVGNLHKPVQGLQGLTSVSHAQVLAMVGNPHYLYRMTVLVALAALAPAVSHDVLCYSMLPAVVSCAKDKARLLAPLF